MDEAAQITLGTISAIGAFTASFPDTAAALGRQVAIEISNANGTRAVARRMEFPLYIDFEYQPSSEDNLRLGLEIASDEVGSMRSLNRRETQTTLYDFLRVTKGTVITIRFLDGQSWTCLVNDYKMYETKGPSGRSDTGVAVFELWLTRLT